MKNTDELKVYTGKETIEALLEGKLLKGKNGYIYRFNFNSNEINVRHLEGAEWEFSTIPFNSLSRAHLTEVVTPQVGDWVRVTHSETKVLISTGEITKIDEEGYWGEWNHPASDIITPIYPYEYVTFEILSPEKVSEYKREQAFVNVGRKLNEFRSGDIVYINCLDTVAIVISKKNEANSIIKLHGINEVGKGYDAGSHQLTPISFVEDQVSLD